MEFVTKKNLDFCFNVLYALLLAFFLLWYLKVQRELESWRLLLQLSGKFVNALL